MTIKFVKLDSKAVVPRYATELSAGCDLHACVPNEITIKPGEIVAIGTGISVDIPVGFFGMVCSRSGLALRDGVVAVCSPGVIDSDYRGEIKCIMTNHSNVPFVVKSGMRIAQFILSPCKKGVWEEVAELEKSARGDKGFGSTGLG